MNDTDIKSLEDQIKAEKLKRELNALKFMNQQCGLLVSDEPKAGEPLKMNVYFFTSSESLINETAIARADCTERAFYMIGDEKEKKFRLMYTFFGSESLEESYTHWGR